MVPRRRFHHHGQNSRQVQSRELHHNGVEQILTCEVAVASLLQSVLSRDTSLIFGWVGHIPVIVSLHDKPSALVELGKSMHLVIVSLNDTALVAFHPRNHKIYRSSYSFGSELGDCPSVGAFFIDYLFEEPAGRNSIFHEDVDEVVLEVGLGTGVDFNWESTRFAGSEGEHAADHCIAGVKQLVSSVVLNVGYQVRQEFPHVEVQISAMDYFALWSSNDHPCAGFDGRVLIHEVYEEYFIEGMSWQFRDSVYFRHEILIFELFSSVVFHALEETFGEGDHVEEMHEFV